jgi:hypothetical protein
MVLLYQMSGSTEVALDGEAKMLNAGEGLFIAGGKTAALTARSGGPSTFLHFFLAPAVGLGRPVETGLVPMPPRRPATSESAAKANRRSGPRSTMHFSSARR